jgi:hypothetical protein
MTKLQSETVSLNEGDLETNNDLLTFKNTLLEKKISEAEVTKMKYKQQTKECIDPI